MLECLSQIRGVKKFVSEREIKVLTITVQYFAHNVPYGVNVSSYGGVFFFSFQKSHTADGSNLERLFHLCGSKGNTSAICILPIVCSLPKDREVDGESHLSGSLWNTGEAAARAIWRGGILLHGGDNVYYLKCFWAKCKGAWLPASAASTGRTKWNLYSCPGKVLHALKD